MRNFIIKLGFLLLIIFSFTKMGAQNISQDTVTRSAPIFYDVMGNQVEFNPQMPPLNQVAGAPKAFYTYYWEFGDGNFSFKEKPKHNYKKKGEYTARLWSTNNYRSEERRVGKEGSYKWRQSCKMEKVQRV